MFGPKKHKVSKEDLKKSVINANTKLVSANKRLEGDINAKEERLKALDKEYNKCKEALKETKEMKVLAENDLNGIHTDITGLDNAAKEALSRLASLSEEVKALESKHKKLQDKNDTLETSIKSLEERKVEFEKYTKSLNQLKEEELQGQETLELLAIELNELEDGVESYISRKSAAKGEFDTFKEKIAREKETALEELKSIKDRMADATLQSGKEMGRLDKAIADRMTELQDMDSLIAKKDYEFLTIQSKLAFVEEETKEAKDKADRIVSQAQEKATKIKLDFKDWKVEALDEVARLKIKGKIENINKAGLKEILDG